MENILYSLGKYLVNVYSFFAFKFDILYKDDFPKGAKIFVANHPSTTDPFLPIILVKEKVRILISKRLFDTPIFGPYLKLAGHIPVDFENGKTAFVSAKKRLEKGESVVIFIEGDVSPPEGFHKPKTGAVRLSLETKAPIIPLGFSLNQTKIKYIDIKIKNEAALAHWYTNGPYAITFGKPIYLNGSSENRDLVRSRTFIVMNNIAKLSLEGKLRLVKKNQSIKSLSSLQHYYCFRYAFNFLNLTILLFGSLYEKISSLVEKYST